MAHESVDGEHIRRKNRHIWCDRCANQQHKDILHLLWECPKSREVWEWVRATLFVARSLSQNLEFTVAHALLGGKLPMESISIRLSFEEILRGQAMWEL
jgi:ribosomal protein L37AE/L43A